jgi:broad specificity phosphatase PhoE
MDVPLDELGRRQAEALGQSPLFGRVTRVVSSPLRRALETAAALGRPVTVDERWTEIDYGIFDGLELDRAGELFRQWGRDIGFVPEGGESLLSVGDRVRAACEDLWPEAIVDDLVVVSHVSPIKAGVAWALGVDDHTTWRMFVDVASVSCIGPGRPGPATPLPSLRLFNDIHERPSS